PGVTGAGTVVNSTIEGNSSPGFGGAVFIANGSDLTFLSSTIALNTANDDNNLSGDGGGIYNNSSNVAIANTILAGNTVGAGAPSADGQCAGASFTSSGFNLRSVNDSGCSGFNGTGDLGDADATKLGTLGDNGGPTPTVALLTGNPAIEGGNPDSPVDGLFPTCPTTDQRGVSRLGNNVCDIGAFEKRSPTTTALNCSPAALIFGSGSSNCTATVTDLAGLTVPTGDITFKTDGDGSFSPARSGRLPAAATASASCSVNYTPTAIGTGLHLLGAFYDGTPDLTDSGDSEAISVGTAPPSVTPGGTTDRAAAIKKCTKKFPKGPKRKKCIKKAKKRFPA